MPQVASDQSLERLVLDGVLGVSEFGRVGRKSSTQDNGLAGSNGDSALEVGNEFAVLLDQHGEVLEQLVVNALLDTNLGTDLVLEGSHGEGERREALAGLSEESSGLLQLQIVDVLELALEDGRALVTKLGLAFAGGDVDIKVDNLALLELPLLNILHRLLLGDDHLVAVDAVLLGLVRKNTFDHVAAVLGSDLVHVLGNFSVSTTVFNQTFGSTETVVSSFDRVSSAGLGLTIANNNGVGSVDSEAINMSTTNNLGNLTSFKDSGLILERAVVTNDVVDGDAAGECNTTVDLLGLLSIVDLLKLGLNEGINLLANIMDVGFGLAQRNGMFHSSYKHIKLDIPKC